MALTVANDQTVRNVALIDPVSLTPYDASGLVPNNALAVNGSSGNVANAAAAVTLPAAVGKINYLAGFQLTGGGATAASIVALTITGLLGGTQTYNVPVPAGATVGLQPIAYQFYPPLPASAANVAITVSCAALGAGNTNAALNVQGFQK